MSQRESGYERRERDSYETPAWVTAALVPHLPITNGKVWEPACGHGAIVNVLRSAGHSVVATDIADYGIPITPPGYWGRDFLLETDAPKGTEAIITNPPYTFAQAFIECALELMRPEGRVAMLLRMDYDHAKTRQHLFAGCPAFARKLVLTKRIVWFDGPRAAPSFNHCWMIWNWKHVGPPTLAYGPIT
jgi:hypothetical protein